MKRLLWFALGATVGILAYPRISQKIVELGQGETLMRAQDWVSAQVDAAVAQVNEGGSGHGVS